MEYLQRECIQKEATYSDQKSGIWSHLKLVLDPGG